MNINIISHILKYYYNENYLIKIKYRYFIKHETKKIPILKLIINYNTHIEIPIMSFNNIYENSIYIYDLKELKKKKDYSITLYNNIYNMSGIVNKLMKINNEYKLFTPNIKIKLNEKLGNNIIDKLIKFYKH